MSNWSLVSDLAIPARTLPAVLKRRGAAGAIPLPTRSPAPEDPVRRALPFIALVVAATALVGCNFVGRAPDRPGRTAIRPLPPVPTTVDRPAPAGWRLVWSDEFDGSAVDTSVWRSEEQTSELQSIMRTSYAVF